MSAPAGPVARCCEFDSFELNLHAGKSQARRTAARAPLKSRDIRSLKGEPLSQLAGQCRRYGENFEVLNWEKAARIATISSTGLASAPVRYRRHAVKDTIIRRNAMKTPTSRV